MKKLKTILCGTNYGSVYLRYLIGLEQFELTAILSRGSERSKDISQRLELSNYTSLEQIDECFDLAIIAVSKAATFETAKFFLQKKTSILLEHPVSHFELSQLNDIAIKNNVEILVNGHFIYMENINSFVSASCEAKENLLGVSVDCYSRTLFSTIDILHTYLGKPIKPPRILENNSLFKLYILDFDKTKVTLKMFKSTSNLDDSSDAVVGHNIVNYYQSYSIALTHTWGVVVHSAIPKKESLSNIIKISDSSVDFNKLLKLRDKAICSALMKSYSLIISNCKNEMHIDRYLSISKIYSHLVS